jgi:hypothetical protein
MFALFEANRAAIRAARDRRSSNSRIAAALAATMVLSACAPATTPLAGKDPADPAAKVAAVGYRSALAPYTSLRPATPAPWPARNDDHAPRTEPEQ